MNNPSTLRAARIVLFGLAAGAAAVPVPSYAGEDALWREQVAVETTLRIEARASLRAPRSHRSDLLWRDQVAQPSAVYVVPLVAAPRASVGRDLLWREQHDSAPQRGRSEMASRP